VSCRILLGLLQGELPSRIPALAKDRAPCEVSRQKTEDGARMLPEAHILQGYSACLGFWVRRRKGTSSPAEHKGQAGFPCGWVFFLYRNWLKLAPVSWSSPPSPANSDSTDTSSNPQKIPAAPSAFLFLYSSLSSSS
jgi:hypothetical protein